MDYGKAEAVTSWPQPKTSKELQHFLGFVNLYRKFISGFSTMSAPLMSILKGKLKNLKWTTGTSEAFDVLQYRFPTASILHCTAQIPDLQFFVVVDASENGVKPSYPYVNVN